MGLDWKLAFIKYPNGTSIPIIISNYLYRLSSGDKVIKQAATKTACRDAMISETFNECYKVYGNLRYNTPFPLSYSISNENLLMFHDFFNAGAPSLDSAYSEYDYNGYILPHGEITPNHVVLNGTQAALYNTGIVPDYKVNHGEHSNVFKQYEFGLDGVLVLPAGCLDENLKLSVDSSKFMSLTSTTVRVTYLTFTFTKYSGHSTYGNDWVGRYSIFGSDMSKSTIDAFSSELKDVPQSSTTIDPFTPNPIPGSPGGISSSEQGGDGTGGGWGDFDYSSDGPEDKDPPSVTIYDAGFCTLYGATQEQIRALANYMWADTNNFLDNWQKLWANPMDAILGISLVPMAGLLQGVSSAVKVGNISTNVLMTKLTSSIVKVECGSLHITSQSLSHSFMDFPPYNQVQIYLPYIGTVPISATDVIDKYLSVFYLCDVLSGSCVAFLLSNGYTVATYSGNIAAAVPVTSGDFANIVFAALDYLKVVSGDAQTAGILASGGKKLKPSSADLFGFGLNAVEGAFEVGHSVLVPQITKGGPAGSTAGYMNHQKPFLIFNAPNIAAPENMNTYIGYAQYETMSLGSCHGYTKVSDIHYRGRGTQAERDEIEMLLKAGVDF